MQVSKKGKVITMKNLIQSDFYRLFKSKSFYICSAISMFLITLGIIILKLSNNMLKEANPQFTGFPYKNALSYAVVAFQDSSVTMIISIFIAIFIVVEFSHGTMKNPVSKGFGKLQIYLAKLITMSTAAIIIFAFTFLAGLIAAMIVLKGMGDINSDSIVYILKVIGIELILNFALIAIYIMVSMIIRNLGGVIAVNIIGVISVGLLPFKLVEFLTHGKLEATKYWILNNIAFYAMNESAKGSDFLRSALVGIVFFAIATVIGIFVFQKSDIK